MKKWIVSLFAVLLINNSCFSQLTRQDFNTITVHKESFKIYCSNDQFSITNQRINKSEKPPVIDTSSNKQGIVEGELDIGKHRWEEIPIGSNNWYSQRYWSPEDKTYFRWQKPKDNPQIIQQSTPQIVRPIQYINNPQPIQSPVQFIPQVQLQYIQPRPSISFSRTVNC